MLVTRAPTNQDYFTISIKSAKLLKNRHLRLQKLVLPVHDMEMARSRWDHEAEMFLSR
jgi:hypothetical protein